MSVLLEIGLYKNNVFLNHLHLRLVFVTVCQGSLLVMWNSAESDVSHQQDRKIFSGSTEQNT